MPRRTTPNFRCPALEALARQLLFAPPQRRIEQIYRAEQLHDQIDPEVSYPQEYIQFRVTGYRGEAEDAALLAGEAVLPDLRLIIDQLSFSVDLPPSPDEPEETPKALAQRLNVTIKTLTRWRVLGLRWHWVKPPGARLRMVVYPRSAVEAFVARYAPRVERAGRIHHIDPATRDRLLTRARRIAQARQVTLNQVATHLARRTGWSLEAMRQMLEKHERQHPKDPIIADRTGPLNAHQKRLITRAYQMGVSVAAMARKFGRTRAGIYRILRERRAMDLHWVILEHFTLPTFAREDADEVFLAPLSDEAPPPRSGVKARRGLPAPQPEPGPPHDLPELLRDRYAHPTLDADRQHTLLVRLNYLKYRAAEVRQRLNVYNPSTGDLDRIEELLKLAEDARQRLTAGNLATVLATARRHLVGLQESSSLRLQELLEIGDQLLAEAIEAFDPTRGGSFESYLTWALMRRFASLPAPRTAPATPAAPPVAPEPTTPRAHRRDQRSHRSAAP